MGYEWLVASALPHIGGFAGALVTRKQIPTWYESLKKPDWRPPKWAFGPVWTSLYTGMGYASYLVWRDGGGFNGSAKLPLALYASQLALNWAWTPIFFGAHKLGLAFAEVVVLWANIAACVYTFHPVSQTASYLMVPYLGWVTLASALNYCIWKDNPQEEKAK